MTTSINQTIAQIAEKHLFIDTLETRHCDSLDFHDLAVWCVRQALEEAYKAGLAAASSSKAKKSTTFSE